MRIYEGSPRQDYEEVFRSIGAFVDQRGLQEILMAEAPDGFILQGIVGQAQSGSAWQDPSISVTKETYTFLDEDIVRFLEDSHARRRSGPANDGTSMAGPYERVLRVIGRYIDDQKPKDVFFLEQDGAGQLIVAPGSGVTILSAQSLKARAQYSAIQLIKVATNEWVLLGDLQAEGYERVALTAQTASIGTTAILTSPAAGLFEVDVYIETTTAGSAGTVLATIGHTDRIGATTQATSTLALDSVGRKIQRFLVYAASGNVTYATTVAGASGSPQYALDIAIRRQSAT